MKTSTTTVTIACPDWCIIDPQEHADELDGWEGRVMHQSAWTREFYIAQTTDLGGRPWPWERENVPEPVIGIFDGQEVRTADEVEALALTLLKMVAQVRLGLRAIGETGEHDSSTVGSPGLQPRGRRSDLRHV